MHPIESPWTAIVPSLLLACCRPAGMLESVDVTVAEKVPTTVDIRVQSHAATGGLLRYGIDELEHERELERIQVDSSVDSGSDSRSEGETFTERLWGLLPSSTYRYEVCTLVEGETTDCQEGTFETGSPPESLWGHAVEVYDPDRLQEGFIATVLMTGAAAVILDTEGRYRWWWVDGREDLTYTRARISQDGEHVLYSAYDSDLTEEIIRVDLAGDEVEYLSMPGLHHDFTEREDGTLAWLGAETHDVDGGTALGDVLLETTPEGVTREIVRFWDHFEYQGDDLLPNCTWSHANFVTYLDEEDLYLVALRNLESIVAVERETGEVAWIFGGEDSDWTLGGGVDLTWQHGFHYEGDRMWTMGLEYEDATHSRARGFALDTDSETDSESSDGNPAELVWDYVSDPQVLSAALGDIRHLEGGNLLVNYSMSGQMDQVTESEDLVWRMNVTVGEAYGYARWYDSLPP